MIRISSNVDKVANNVSKRSSRAETATRQILLDTSRFIMERAKFYSGSISGPYSKGVSSGKLQASIGRSVGKYNATVFQKFNQVPYGSLQESGVGASHFIGYRPIVGRGMVRVRKPPYHSGFKGKKYMQRAAADGRREVKNITRRNIKIAIR